MNTVTADIHRVVFSQRSKVVLITLIKAVLTLAFGDLLSSGLRTSVENQIQKLIFTAATNLRLAMLDMT